VSDPARQLIPAAEDGCREGLPAGHTRLLSRTLQQGRPGAPPWRLNTT
jgi:hypothetical protein